MNEGKKDKVLSRTRLYALIPYHYTAEADCVTLGKSLLFNAFSMELSPATAFKDDRAASTELLTVKKKKQKTKNNVNAFHGND